MHLEGEFPGGAETPRGGFRVLAAFAAGSRSERGLSTTQLAGADARAVLAIAPSPAGGLKVSKTWVETALRRGGRQRRISSIAASAMAALRAPQRRMTRSLSRRCAPETLALLGVLDAICASVDQIAGVLTEVFARQPGYETITSFPGLADISGAIVLAEIGDDRDRSPTTVRCRPSRMPPRCYGPRASLAP